MTAEIVDFLTARWDEEEAAARRVYTHSPWRPNETHQGWPCVEGDGWTVCTIHEADAAHIARHDPAHVLADIAAKRAILRAHGSHRLPLRAVEDYDGDQHLGTRLGTLFRCRSCESPPDITRDTWPCPTLRHFAAVYEQHPEYKDTWRP